jgi:hypothetical protein
MALTARINLVVPDLPDADVWFANAAAWKNYWRNIGAEVEFDAAATTIYVPVAYNNALVPFFTVVDGFNYVLVTTAMFESLMNRVNAMEASFQDLRTQMRDAGFITNAQ